MVAATAGGLMALGVIPPASTTTVSITTLPQGDREDRQSHSFRPWVSADGRFVTFDSNATDLVPDDTNEVRDIFVHDRATGATTRVNLGAGGVEADGDSERPTISGDGRYIAFWSEATNLVANDTNGFTDAFVVDRTENTIARVSVGPKGREANGASARPVISADGKFVAFESHASNLLPTGLLNQSTDTNGDRDIFVHELETGTTSRVSVTSDGEEDDGDSLRPTINADGRYIAFHSTAPLDRDDKDEIRDVYLHDRRIGVTLRLSTPSGEREPEDDLSGGSFSPSISADGRHVAFWSNADHLVAGDTNGVADIFVIDRESGEFERVVATDGTEGDEDSSDPSISPDGRYVTFWSAASTLVPGDTNGVRDVFLHDRQTGETTRVSVASDGTQADADSYSPNVGGGGDLVAFDSAASTLVPGDANRGNEIFLYTPEKSTRPGR